MDSEIVHSEDKYAIIGAGPSGLAAAKNLKDLDIPFIIFEMGNEVGGLWNINNPRSTVYESAHLISSKRKTEFKIFPMNDDVPDYPRHDHLFEYFKSFAKEFGIYDHIRFNSSVIKTEPVDGLWQINLEDGYKAKFKGLILANGTLSEPNFPQLKGLFDGEIIHSSQYKNAKIFHDKKVLVVGAGNSGCDIAVDAVHHAKEVDISVRRGYHFVPKYVFGKPADTVGGKIKLPRILKQKLDRILLKWFTGDPEHFGFPKPDHDIYESHPVINSLVLYHAGHGDINVMSDIDHLDGSTVHFIDGTNKDYDLILMATGYVLHFPFLDKKHLNWEKGPSPSLYLNMFTHEHDNLFVAGMVEAAGIGWEGRFQQSRLMAHFIKAKETNPEKAMKFWKKVQGPSPDLSGGYQYMKLDRMSFYVNIDAFNRSVSDHLKMLQ